MVVTILVIVAMLIAAYIVLKRKSDEDAAQEEQQQAAADLRRKDHDTYAYHPEEMGDLDPMKLDLGSIVILDDGRQYPVRGIIEYDDDGWNWRSYYLGDDSDDNEVWLGVEADPEVEVTVWTSVMAGDVDTKVFDPAHDTNGVFQDNAYKLKERGKATYTAWGTTGMKGAGNRGDMVYRDFRSKGSGLLLSAERYGSTGNEYEVSWGRRLAVGTYEFLPSPTSSR